VFNRYIAKKKGIYLLLLLLILPICFFISEIGGLFSKIKSLIKAWVVTHASEAIIELTSEEFWDSAYSFSINICNGSLMFVLNL